MDGMRLSDHRTVLDVARTVGELDTLDEFRSGVLELLPRLVSGDVGGYNEVDTRGGESIVMLDCEPLSSVDITEPLVRLAHQHPLIAHQSTSGDGAACSISDLVSVREYHGREIYDELLRHVLAEDQIAISFRGADDMLIGIAVNRSRRGFGVRDRARLDASRPFFEQAYRNVLDRTRLRAALAGLERAADATARPVMLVRGDGRVESATASAAAWLREEHAVVPGQPLPEPVSSWFAAERVRSGSLDEPAGPPLVLESESGRVRARFVPGGPGGLDAVVLEAPEAPLRVGHLIAIGLTRRESEVLRLASLGWRNGEIAHALDLSPHTVAKHLQNVYSKLDVTSRTAAVQRARERIASVA
jgi:DNA-binding CsgD family transcriptional regulator